MRINGLRIVFLVFLALTGPQGCEKKEQGSYPQKNFFVYIFSSQGGDTDRWVRHLSALMGKELGVNFVCNNLPGAKGGTGAMKVWNSPHNGYTILGTSETSVFFGVNGVGPTVDKWEFFIAGGCPGVIAVHSDSAYTSIEDLVEAGRKEPDNIKISNAGQGNLWHIKAVQFQEGAGVKFQHIPYNGSSPAVTAVLSREVDAVSCSAGEVVEFVRSGMLRPLIMTELVGMEFENFGHVRAAVEIYPDTEYGYSNLFQWLGFLIPSDVPTEVLEVFGGAFEKALNEPKTDEFIKLQMARKIGLRGDETRELAAKMQSIASWKSKELGMAKKDPAKLGIQRPR